MFTKITHTLLIKDKGFSAKSLIQHKFFVGILKLILAGILGLILYYQLFGREDLTIQSLGKEFMGNLSRASIPLILLVLVLMPLNWFFETKKWLALVEKIEHIALEDALKAVLAGLTFSMFTPNRVGEYGARIFMVSEGKRFMAVFATMVGVSSQWIVLIVGGWWGLIVAFSLDLIPIGDGLLGLLVGVGIVVSMLLFAFYFNMQAIVVYCLRFRWTKKWAGRFSESNFKSYTLPELYLALGYSLLRYLIYSIQYLLLLYFFGFDATYLTTFLGITIVYLLQTGIPLPPSTGLLARGNIALLIFGYLSVTEGMPAVILASTFSLWLINVVFPAIVGAIVIAKMGWSYPKK
jgi:hypothetical protein